MAGQDTKVPIIKVGIESIVEVNDDDSLGEDSLDCLITSLEETGILLRITVGMTHGFGDDGLAILVLDFPTLLVSLYTPKHAVGGFITYLYPLGRDAIILQ